MMDYISPEISLDEIEYIISNYFIKNQDYID
jgi:hypothetical protein